MLLSFVCVSSAFFFAASNIFFFSATILLSFSIRSFARFKDFIASSTSLFALVSFASSSLFSRTNLLSFFCTAATEASAEVAAVDLFSNFEIALLSFVCVSSALFFAALSILRLFCTIFLALSIFFSLLESLSLILESLFVSEAIFRPADFNSSFFEEA